jgi:hypothetical protein
MLRFPYASYRLQYTPHHRAPEKRAFVGRREGIACPHASEDTSRHRPWSRKAGGRVGNWQEARGQGGIQMTERPHS